MSKTFRKLNVGITVNDSCDLPDGMGEDSVADEVCDVVQKALDEWYAIRGHELLACEPLVC